MNPIIQQIDEDFGFVVRNIKSCTNKKQLGSCYNLARNFDNKHKYNDCFVELLSEIERKNKTLN